MKRAKVLFPISMSLIFLSMQSHATHLGALFCSSDCGGVPTPTGKTPDNGLHISVDSGLVAVTPKLTVVLPSVSPASSGGINLSANTIADMGVTNQGNSNNVSAIIITTPDPANENTNTNQNGSINTVKETAIEATGQFSLISTNEQLAVAVTNKDGGQTNAKVLTSTTTSTGTQTSTEPVTGTGPNTVITANQTVNTSADLSPTETPKQAAPVVSEIDQAKNNLAKIKQDFSDLQVEKDLAVATYEKAKESGDVAKTEEMRARVEGYKNQLATLKDQVLSVYKNAVASSSVAPSTWGTFRNEAMEFHMEIRDANYSSLPEFKLSERQTASATPLASPTLATSPSPSGQSPLMASNAPVGCTIPTNCNVVGQNPMSPGASIPALNPTQPHPGAATTILIKVQR